MPITPVEGAVGFAIFGSLAAIAIPVYWENVHASRGAEAIDGLARISDAAIAGADNKAIPDAFPPSAPLTPAVIARGEAAVDPPAAWDTPTWKTLDFRAAPEGVPHRFSFQFDSTSSAALSTFTATAHADQDGDGLTSTFEIHGHDDAHGPAADTGTYVDKETE